MRLSLRLGLILCLLLGAATGAAEELDRLRERLAGAPFTLTADRVEYEQTRDLYEASGNVRVEQPGGATLTADWMAFNAVTRAGVATGNVRLQDGNDVLTADFAAIDLDTLEAVASGARLDVSDTGFVVEGSELRKTGENTYAVEAGTFTTCRCPPGQCRRPWEVGARRANIEVGGYAVVRHAVVRVLGLPVAYVPWMMLPVKTERQSGFLIPRVATGGRNGAEVELPFFWALRDDLNLLLRPRWLEDRGFGSGAEFEYVFGEEGYAEGGLAILGGDDEVDRDDVDTRFSDDRWAWWLRHEQPLGRGRVGADWRATSDNEYVVDFQDLDPKWASARFLESSAWGAWARGALSGSARASFWDDLQSPNDLDRDDFLLQRLPDLQISLLPVQLLGVPLRAGLDLRWIQFQQTGDRDDIGGTTPVGGRFFDTGIDGTFNTHEPDATGAFTGGNNHLDDFVTEGGPEGDSLFQEGELLADEGHRVEVYPRLSVPAQLGPIELLVEGGMRETLWFSRELGSEGRRVFTGRADLRTRLERHFRLGRVELVHVLEPRAIFSFLEPRSQRESDPFYIPAGAIAPKRLLDADPRLLLRDPSDRLRDQRFLEVGLQNRFFAAPAGVGRPPRQVAQVRVGSGYDFEASRLTNAWLEAELDPRDNLVAELIFGWDPKEDEIDEALARLRWTHPKGHSLAVDYRYVRNIPQVFEDFAYDDVFDAFRSGFDRINQLGASAEWIAHPRVEFFSDGYVSMEAGSVRGRVGLLLHSTCDCWDLITSLTRQARPGDTRLEVSVRLAGIGLGGL